MVEIRPAQEKDFHIIMPMAFALQEYEASVEEAVVLTEKTKQDLEAFTKKNMARKDARFFIAHLNGHAIGYISGWLSESSLSATGKPYGYICDCFVLEGHRRSGIGRKLLAELMQWFREQDVEYVEAYTYVTNETGKGFWESEKFRPNMTRYLFNMKME